MSTPSAETRPAIATPRHCGPNDGHARQAKPDDDAFGSELARLADRGGAPRSEAGDSTHVRREGKATSSEDARASKQSPPRDDAPPPDEPETAIEAQGDVMRGAVWRGLIPGSLVAALGSLDDAADAGRALASASRPGDHGRPLRALSGAVEAGLGAPARAEARSAPSTVAMPGAQHPAAVADGLRGILGNAGLIGTTSNADAATIGGAPGGTTTRADLAGPDGDRIGPINLAGHQRARPFDAAGSVPQAGLLMQHAESAEVAPVAVRVLGRETHFAPIGWSPGVARSHGMPEPASALRDAGYRHSDGLSGRRAEAAADASLPGMRLPGEGEIPAGGDTTRRGQATRTRERAVQPVDQRIASARGDASAPAAGIAARSADPAPVGAQIFSAIVQTASAANGVEASAPRTAPYGQAVSEGTGNFAPPVRVLRLALAPVELGHVTITLKGHAASLHISIEAERPETAARVESEREALTMRLHEQGYAIEDVAVARSQPVATEPGAQSRERQEPSARDLAGGMRGSSDQGTTGQHGGMGDGARSGMGGSPDRHDRTAPESAQPHAMAAETPPPSPSGQRTGSYSVRRSL